MSRVKLNREERVSQLSEWDLEVKQDLDFRLIHVSPRPDNVPLPAEPKINCRALANLSYVTYDVGRGYIALHPIRYWYQYVRQPECKMYVLLYSSAEDKLALRNLLGLTLKDFPSVSDPHRVETLCRSVASALLWTELYKDIDEVLPLHSQLRGFMFSAEEVLSNRTKLEGAVEQVKSMVPYRLAERLTPRLFTV